MGYSRAWRVRRLVELRSGRNESKGIWNLYGDTQLLWKAGLGCQEKEFLFDIVSKEGYYRLLSGK